MSSYRYNVISYSLLRTLRCARCFSTTWHPINILTRFIFENRCFSFSFSFSFRLVKVAKRESETRFEIRGGGRRKFTFFFFSQHVDKEDVRLDNFLPVLFSILRWRGTWRGHKRIRHFFLEMRSSWGERGGISWGEKGEIHWRLPSSWAVLCLIRWDPW